FRGVAVDGVDRNHGCQAIGRQDRNMVAAASAESVEFYRKFVRFDEQGNAGLVQKLTQCCVCGHYLENFAKERPDKRIGVGDKEQPWPPTLRYQALRFITPVSPEYAVSKELRFVLAGQ